MSAPTRRLPREWWAPTTLPFAPITADLALIGRECRLYGWSLAEAGGTDPATVVLYDGASNNGNLIAPIGLLANGSTFAWLGQPGLRVRQGVYLDLVAGTVFGSIWVVGLTDDEIIELIVQE